MARPNFRILHVTTSYPSGPNDPAGIFVNKLVQALEVEGVSSQVLTPAGTGRCVCSDSHHVNRFRYAPWKWQSLAQAPGGIPQALDRSPILFALLPVFAALMALHLIRLARHCDLVHAHWSFCGAIAVLTQPFHRKPVITTLRGSDTIRASKGGLYSWFHERAMTRSSFVVGVSQSIISELQRRDTSIGEHLSWIPNGVGHDFYEIDPSSRLSSTSIRFLCVGSLIPRKGIDVLLNALGTLDRHHDWKLSIAGDGPEMDLLVGLCNTLGLRDRVRFLGTVPPGQVPSLMADHDVMVLPSHREGRPNVLLEAMAAALPVLGTDVDGIPELIRDNETGWLVPPGNSKALAAALGLILSGAKDLAAMGLLGRRWMVEQGLTWSYTASRYLRLYEKASLPGGALEFQLSEDALSSSAGKGQCAA